jgi:hypothetical protein
VARLLRGFSGAGLAVVILLLAGCKGPPPTKVGFINKLATYNEKLFTIGRAFRTALIPLVYPEENKDNKSFNAESVRKAQADAEKQVNEIREEFDDLVSPRKSEPGKKLRAAYEDFLKIQETIAKDHMKKIVDIVNGGDSDDDKAERIREVMKKIEEDEMEVAGKLADAQKEYTTVHSLRADVAAVLKGPSAGPGGGGSGGPEQPKGPGQPKGQPIAPGQQKPPVTKPK